MKHLREIFKIWQWDNASDTNYSLRNYTDYSVWTQSIRDLYQLAVSNIVSHLSITDKSTIKAYTQGRAMNIWEWFWFHMIPWLETLVKISETTNLNVNMLLYFSERLLKDKKFIKDINDAIEMWKFNWWTDLSDILYLKSRYDIASIISDPFEDELSNAEMKIFLETMVSKLEIDWFYSNKKINRAIPNWYEVPIFIGNEESSSDIKTTSSIENNDFEILSRKWDLWVMIWRLNPPHIGHVKLIKKALKENSKLFLFLWSANKLDEKNPFSSKDRLFFLNFYFKQEIESWKLILWTLDDVWNYEKWVWNLWAKIWEKFPEFTWKVNIYGWNMAEDIAIKAIKQFEDSLSLKNIAYREIWRGDFSVNHNWEKIEISATAVRKALSDWNYELAKKLMNDEIGDLVIHKWKEKNNLLKEKKLFFIYTPEHDRDWNIHRNYKKSEKIKNQVLSDFNQDNIVSDISDADIIIPIWWDWSLLWAIKEYWYLWKPFYPIAAWTKNFIPSNFTHPYQILTEDSEILEFPMLEVWFYDDKWNLLSEQLALNDVYLNVESWTMWKLMISWDDYLSRIIEWDWIIISTPIGSTAYTKNSWWNVLPLNNDVLSITDINSSWHISHIVSAKQNLVIDIIRWKFIAHADSFEQKWVYQIRIKKSEKIAKIIFPVWEEFRLNRYK